MANKLKKKIKIIVLIVLFIISIGFNIYLYNFSLKDDTEFFNNYVIAINDYHVADSYFELAVINLENANWYTETDYYYDTAINYIDLGKDQTGEAKQLLLHAKSKLDILKDIPPNEFYREEINNRIEQTDILLDLNNQYYLLLDYMSKSLYEINYGSETEATRYHLLYNDLIPEINENMQKLSDISQEIDLAWDEDWYVLFEGA